MGLKKCAAPVMVAVIQVNQREERTGVHNEAYLSASSRRISSIRSEMSPWPLFPAPEETNSRLFEWPRWASIASRVSSETVLPFLAASWRRRLSRSSGSFTVVRFMVCQHTKNLVEMSLSIRTFEPVARAPFSLNLNANSAYSHTGNGVRQPSNVSAIRGQDRTTANQRRYSHNDGIDGCCDADHSGGALQGRCGASRCFVKFQHPKLL